MPRLLPLLLVLLVAGCSSRDGDILSRACARAGKKFETAAGNAPGRLAASFRVPVVALGPAERVRKRIEWDRHLEGSHVEVDSPAEGVVRLRGTVSEPGLKQRMGDLARSTIGVREVRDELRLPKEE
jgi:hypothetical protein